MKACSTCGEIKPLTEFHRDRRAGDGYERRCRVCRSAQYPEYYARTLEHQVQRHKTYYEEQKTDILTGKQQYRRDHVVERQEYHRQYYETNRDHIRANTDKNRRDRLEWLRQLKSTLSCSRCGEKHLACLDFHHRDPSQKEGLIGQMANRGLSEKRILAEIAKCDVLCCNCHRKQHWEEKEWLRREDSNLGPSG